MVWNCIFFTWNGCSDYIYVTNASTPRFGNFKCSLQLWILRDYMEIYVYNFPNPQVFLKLALWLRDLSFLLVEVVILNFMFCLSPLAFPKISHLFCFSVFIQFPSSSIYVALLSHIRLFWCNAKLGGKKFHFFPTPVLGCVKWEEWEWNPFLSRVIPSLHSVFSSRYHWELDQE